MNSNTVAIARSTHTACHRLILTPIAWRLRPDEYRSTAFTAERLTIARMRYGPTNQFGSAADTPSTRSAAPGTVVVTAAPRSMKNICGIMAPMAEYQNTCFLGAFL